MWTVIVLCVLTGITTGSVIQYSTINVTATTPIYGFQVDYENNQFLLDGKPFRYVSGSFHYFRTPKVYWRDRLRKMRAAGLNAVSTNYYGISLSYVEWSLHEPEPNVWRWTGEADIVEFLTLAQEEDLLVLLRPGPYICAERDLGGLPAWLMTLVPDISMRTNDTRYMSYVQIYIDQLMQRVVPLLRGNGGPIIMVQVENEYGSFFACDESYRQSLRGMLDKHVRSKALLYTTDGSYDEFLRCGTVPGAYATVDFGATANVTRNFRLMRKYQPKGPLVNSEYYSGWLTHWDEEFQAVKTKTFIKTLQVMLRLNASVNIYMFYGGTNFGFTAGANGGDKYWPQITSYDYDAPLDEAGDPTDKYFALRDAIAEFLPMPNLPLPTVAPKGDYGLVQLECVTRLFDPLARTAFGTVPEEFFTPPTFEQLSMSHGLVLYETNFTPGTTDPSIFRALTGDRGLVYIDDYLTGTLSRTLRINTLILQNPYAQRLAVLVESQGHLNYGDVVQDWKGLFNPMINNDTIEHWNVTGFSLDDIQPLTKFLSSDIGWGNLIHGPVFLRATFNVDNKPLDTYLNTAGWGKGVAYVNGYNLGRYWPKTGPQVTLYVPAIYLRPGQNDLVLLELEYIPKNYQMTFQAIPELGKKFNKTIKHL